MLSSSDEKKTSSNDEKKVVPLTVEQLKTQNVEIENLKSFVNNMYTGKHVANMTDKVQRIEKYMQKHIQTCYTITFFIVFLFLIILLGVVYVIWKFNCFSTKRKQRRPFQWKKFSRSKFGSVSCPELAPPPTPKHVSLPTMSVQGQ
jgi:hypothetical protein